MPQKRGVSCDVRDSRRITRIRLIATRLGGNFSGRDSTSDGILLAFREYRRATVSNSGARCSPGGTEISESCARGSLIPSRRALVIGSSRFHPIRSIKTDRISDTARYAAQRRKSSADQHSCRPLLILPVWTADKKECADRSTIFNRSFPVYLPSSLPKMRIATVPEAPAKTQEIAVRLSAL